MGERNIENIEKVEVEAKPSPKEEKADENGVIQSSPLIDVNYSKPTPVSNVVADVSEWTGITFVMEPAQDTFIQIFSSRLLPKEEAYEAFIAALRVVGLRATQQKGENIVKILPFRAFPVLI